MLCDVCAKGNREGARAKRKYIAAWAVPSGDAEARGIDDRNLATFISTSSILQCSLLGRGSTSEPLEGGCVSIAGIAGIMAIAQPSTQRSAVPLT
jgi:hypothetical protein